MFWELIVVALVLIGMGIFGRIFFDMHLVACIFLFLFAGLAVAFAFLLLTISLTLL